MQRFPKILEGGSFRVRLRFEAAPKKDLATIQRWLTGWAAAIAEEMILGHHFSELFASAPEAAFDSAGHVSIVLKGLPLGQRLWKDWYVRLVRDTLDAFPDLGKLSGVENDAQSGF
jgi:hypothetical protein